MPLIGPPDPYYQSSRFRGFDCVSATVSPDWYWMHAPSSAHGRELCGQMSTLHIAAITVCLEIHPSGRLPGTSSERWSATTRPTHYPVKVTRRSMNWRGATRPVLEGVRDPLSRGRAAQQHDYVRLCELGV